MPTYHFIENGQLDSSKRPPVGLMPFTHMRAMAQMPDIKALHQSMRAWAEAGYSVGALTPQSLFVGADGRIALLFADNHAPQSLTTLPAGAKDRAAWLLLLDKIMPTDTVIARAAQVWSHGELVAALPFVTPIFLPSALVRYPPDNCVRVAHALAVLAARPAPAAND